VGRFKPVLGSEKEKTTGRKPGRLLARLGVRPPRASSIVICREMFLCALRPGVPCDRPCHWYVARRGSVLTFGHGQASTHGVAWRMCLGPSRPIVRPRAGGRCPGSVSVFEHAIADPRVEIDYRHGSHPILSPQQGLTSLAALVLQSHQAL
jgi:hypothetical protein